MKREVRCVSSNFERLRAKILCSALTIDGCEDLHHAKDLIIHRAYRFMISMCSKIRNMQNWQVSSKITAPYHAIYNLLNALCEAHFM